MYVVVLGYPRRLIHSHPSSGSLFFFYDFLDNVPTSEDSFAITDRRQLYYILRLFVYYYRYFLLHVYTRGCNSSKGRRWRPPRNLGEPPRTLSIGDRGAEFLRRVCFFFFFTLENDNNGENEENWKKKRRQTSISSVWVPFLVSRMNVRTKWKTNLRSRK